MNAHQRRVRRRQTDRDFAWYWTTPEFQAEADEARASGVGHVIETPEDMERFRVALNDGADAEPL